MGSNLLDKVIITFVSEDKQIYNNLVVAVFERHMDKFGKTNEILIIKVSRDF